MGATAFLADFARLHGCSVRLIADRAFTAGGDSVPMGNACWACGECMRATGTVGLAEGDIRLVNSVADGLALEWACPGCGVTVTESARPLEVQELAQQCAADRLCVRCRK